MLIIYIITSYDCAHNVYAYDNTCTHTRIEKDIYRETFLASRTWSAIVRSYNSTQNMNVLQLLSSCDMIVLHIYKMYTRARTHTHRHKTQDTRHKTHTHTHNIVLHIYKIYTCAHAHTHRHKTHIHTTMNVLQVLSSYDMLVLHIYKMYTHARTHTHRHKTHTHTHTHTQQ